MNITEKIGGLTEVSEYMSQNDTTLTLKQYETVLDDGRYLLAFMGQFSAGKSKLINNLLGKTVLPVHITETTALITYIEYGETEEVVLEKESGLDEFMSVEQSLEIWQNGSMNDKISDVSAIRIYLNNDILKNGLVIADTPGVNTVFQPHVDKTVKLLQSANRIVYVMSKTATASDVSFLKCILDNGIDTILVRTHMDLINSDEEDYNKTIEAEKSELRQFTKDPVFFLSTIEESSFYSGVSELRNHLSDKLANDISKGLSEAIEKRLSVIGENLSSQLKERKKIAEDFSKNEASAYENTKKELEGKIQKLNDVLERNKESAKEKYKNTEAEADRELNNNCERASASACEEIKQWPFIEKQDDYPARTEQLVKEKCLKLREDYIAYYDRFIKEDGISVCDGLGDLFANTDIEEYIPYDIEDSSAKIDELQLKIEGLFELQEMLVKEMQECDLRKESADGDMNMIEEERRSLSEAMDSVKSELDNYGDYVERYKIKAGNHSSERKMKAIGCALDFATILIPGEGWAKLASGAVKGAAIAKGGSKVAKGIRILEEGGKASKAVRAAKGADVVGILNKADLAADVARSLHMLKKNGGDTEGYIDVPYEEIYEGKDGKEALQEKLKEKKPGLLDYISIEYYFGKLGQKFDSPDRVVVDEDWERQYNEGRDKIVSEFRRIGEQEAQKRIDLLHIKDQIEQEELRKKEIEKSLEKSKNEIEKLKLNIEKEKKNKAKEKCIEYYSECAKERIYDFKDSLLSEFKPSLKEKIDVYFDTYGMQLKQKIQRENEELLALADRYSDSGADDCKAEAEKCESYIDFIQKEIII